MMTKTESIWLNPAAAYAMWFEMWTAWTVAAFTFWMPQALPGQRPAAGPDAGSDAKAPAAPSAIRSGDAGRAAANGAIAGQAVNGHCAW